MIESERLCLDKEGNAQLIEAVRTKVFPLGDRLRVYPGHGPATTIGKERMTNPFFRNRS